MNFNQSGVPLNNLITVFCVLLFWGIVLCVPLFKFNFQKFFRSTLFVKIIFWIPIFVLFVAVIYAGNWLRFAALSGLIIAVLLEIAKQYKPKFKKIMFVYAVLFVFSFSHFYFIEKQFSKDFNSLIITICFATALADVFAFFFGNYLGRHKLPAVINSNKSWEGAFGELTGAMLGVLLVNAFVIEVVSLWIFIPIGLGAVVGDLANSYVKRKLQIKQWSNALPGHGGFADRFSSIAGSAALTFYFLIIVL
jgi:phosphatidate cytidylyltransferase